MNKTTSTSSWRSGAVWGNLLVLLLLSLLEVALFKLQSGDWWIATPRRENWLGAALSLLAYVAFCAIIFWRSRPRPTVDDSSGTGDQAPVLVAYASQTGFAQQVAERTAASLRLSGLPVRLRALSQVDQELLAKTERVLLIASTTGEGDPPDLALSFVREVMRAPANLGHLKYAVLALGDREYEAFCGFGHQLDNWLRQHGAKPLFDLVEVDNADESALRHWQHHLGQIGGVTDLPDWAPTRYENWTLVTRTHINPGSVGGAAFHVSLQPTAGTMPHWLAGDIAEIGPRQSPQAVQALLDGLALDPDSTIRINDEALPLAEAISRSHLPTHEELSGQTPQAIADLLNPLPHREYSIASLPADGNLQLLLRRMLRPDGTPGIGSGWLCDYAALGGDIALRLRSNSNFHPPANGQPLILIGNGTGIAGLRAHLKARAASGQKRNWLLFGERNAERDFFFGDEISEWQSQEYLERVDLAFSRDQPQRLYVQDKLCAAAELLREWMEAGAAIYVCGSLAGMAPGVDAVLREILGDTQVEELMASGRYRRDVY